jgi:hypothetical protein
MAEGRQDGPAGIGGGFGVGMGGGPSGGLIGGSGYQQMDEGVEDSPTAPDTTGMPNDPSFSGSNAVIDVDTFEDIRAAQMARDVREGGGYAGYAGYRRNDPNTRLGSGSYRPAGARPGSVNLAPVGINVGYQVARQIDNFDQLDASTKAAVKAAQIQSQSEDETENAIAQIFGAFQSVMNKAKKNTTNRTEWEKNFPEASQGPDN